ncbi:MAG: DUF4337 family protein [Gemmataceae bacterium]
MEPPKTVDLSTAAKPIWERILTTTPVIMTILSTLLAGLSSSEMTQAQYHRSLAAQYQSKAGDQWGFFQAKRIRGSGLENSAEALQTQVNLSDSSELEIMAHRVSLTLRRIGKEAGDLAGKADPTQTRKDNSLRSALEQLQSTAQAESGKSADSEKVIHEALNRPEVHKIFDFLKSSKIPGAADEAIEDPSVNQALQALAERQADNEVDKTVASLSNEKIQQALETAQKNAKQADEVTEPLTKGLAQVEQAVKNHVALAMPVLRAERKAEEASEMETNKEPNANLQTVLDSAKLQADIERLQKGFRAVHLQYNGLRNRREADYNQKIAYVDEIQVHKSGLTSERHRQRSKNFFYGMLVAQAGMAISSFALAARQKSVLWTLACLAGLTAVAFSGYVYLSM